MSACKKRDLEKNRKLTGGDERPCLECIAQAAENTKVDKVFL